MIGVVVGLTLKQLLGQRRSWLVVLLAVIPVLVGLAIRLSGDPELETSAQEIAARVILEGHIVLFVLPLTALIFGTAALGQEFEEGTSIYLLARPVPRWQIVVGKLLAAWLATSAVVVASVVLSGATVLAGREDAAPILLGFSAATVLGALGYLTLFLCLSIMTGRALAFGIGYVFLWEATVTSFAPGTQYLSVREYTLGIAEALAAQPASVFDAALDVAPSVVLLTLLVLVATAQAIRALMRYETTSAAS